MDKPVIDSMMAGAVFALSYLKEQELIKEKDDDYLEFPHAREHIVKYELMCELEEWIDWEKKSAQAEMYKVIRDRGIGGGK